MKKRIKLKEMVLIFLPLVAAGVLFLLRLDWFQGKSFHLRENAFILQFFAVLLSIGLAGGFLGKWNILKIEKFLEKNQKWVLICFVGFFALVYGTITFNQHIHFQTHAFDLAIYDRTAWQYGRFNFGYYENLVQMRKMADHFEPILSVPGLLYWIYKTPFIVLGFEAIMIALGFVPVYLIAKKILKKNLPAVFMGLAFVLFAGVLSAVTFPIHPGAWLATFYGFMIYFALDKKFKWYYVFMALALLSKESTALHMLYVGFFLLVIMKQKKHGLITMVTGVVWYAVTIKWLMPALNGGQPYVHGVFENISNDPKEFVKFIVSHPVKTVQIMFDQPVKKATFLATLASSGFLAVLSPAFILLVLPMIFERLITEHPGMISMNFQYSVPVAIMLIFSSILTISWITRKFKKESLVYYLSGYVMFCSIFISCVLRSPLAVFGSVGNFKMNDEVRQAYEVVRAVPKDRSVIAQETLVPHLTYRDKVGLFPGDLTKYDFVVLSKDPNYPCWPTSYAEILKVITNLRADRYWRVYKENANFVLFQRLDAK